MADFNFDSKVKTDGISKADFVAKMKEGENAVEEAKAQSIFDKFNTNTSGESADKLDEQEQANVLAFLKNVAGDDTKIVDSEFAAKAELAKTFGFESGEQNVLSKTASVMSSLAGDKAKTASFADDGKKVTVGDNTYEYNDNAQLQSVTTGTGDKAVTRKMKQKYDPVHLSSNWKMQRDVGGKIASGEGDYAGVKDMASAEEVLDKILKAKGITIDDEAKKTTLLKTFIKFNPSVFDRETGKVWLNADWTKLDFPVEKTVDSMISSDADLSGVGEKIKASVKGAKDKKANTPDAELKQNDSNITVSSGDTTYASIYESSGWMSGDAYLNITDGKYKGKYKFIDKDDDNLNYSNFKLVSVNGGESRISVGKNKIKYIKGTDENGVERKFEVKTDDNGYMTVKVGDKEVPLETFMKSGR